MGYTRRTKPNKKPQKIQEKLQKRLSIQKSNQELQCFVVGTRWEEVSSSSQPPVFSGSTYGFQRHPNPVMPNPPMLPTCQTPVAKVPPIVGELLVVATDLGSIAFWRCLGMLLATSALCRFVAGIGLELGENLWTCWLRIYKSWLLSHLILLLLLPTSTNVSQPESTLTTCVQVS